MKIAVIFLTTLAIVLAQDCADQLKEFRTCMETFAAANPPDHFGPPSPPDIKDFMENAGKCFTDNGCTKNPLTELIEEMEKRPPPPPPGGPPPGDFPPPGAPPHGGPPRRSGAWMEKKRAKWRCVDQIAKEDFQPAVQTCIQQEIPGWVFPEKPENESAVYDPFGEGPISFRAMMMKHRGPPPPPPHGGPPSPPTRVKRHPPGGWGMGKRWRGGRRFGPPPHGPPPHLMDKIVASAIFDSEVCPVGKREAVRTCVEGHAATTHEEICSDKKSPLHMMIKKYEMHTKFCDNRDTCFEKINEDCRNDFWDQKWYMARCFQQESESMSTSDWERVEAKFDKCLEDAKVDLDDDEADESSEESSEEGIFRGTWKQRKLRRCISMRFRNGPIRNPCKKLNGQYKILMDHGPFGRHHGPPMGMRHHGPPRFFGHHRD